MNGRQIEELKIGEYAEQSNCIVYSNAALYANIVGDKNPIHFETEEAKRSRYGKPIAHGMILAGFISGVIGTALPGDGCIYAKQSITFVRPVYYGDEILTRVTVTEIDPERNRVKLKTECFNQNGSLVLTGDAVVLPKSC